MTEQWPQRNLPFFNGILMPKSLQTAAKKRISTIMAAALTAVFLLLAFGHRDLNDKFLLTRADGHWLDAKVWFQKAAGPGLRETPSAPVRDAWHQRIDLVAILIFGVVLGYFLPRADTRTGVFLSLFLFIGFAAANYWTFARLNWFLSFAYPGLSLVITSSGLLSYKYLTEKKEKQRKRRAFQHCLDPRVVDQVLSHPELLKLEGERRELSVLFSNIRGFSTFCEKMAPGEVVHFLNKYLQKMQGIIWRNHGTLDKLVGDAVTCFWGAPLRSKDDALRSVITALEMIQAVEDLRGVLVLPGGGKFDVGIGVNTGPMIVGDMGSMERLNYTVVGHNVDLGALLESFNKIYGTRTIISDTTYEAVKEVIFCRQLDTIQFKGRSEMTIYEPLGIRPLEFERRRTDRRGAITLKKRMVRTLVMLIHGERRHENRRLGSARLVVRPEQEETTVIYEHALELYRKGDFEGAESGFDHVLSLNPTDGPAKLMKDRIAKFREEAGASRAADYTDYTNHFV